MSEKMKVKLVWPLIFLAVAIVAVLLIKLVTVPMTINGEFRHTVEYDEETLFPDEEFKWSWVVPLRPVQLCIDKDFDTPASDANSFALNASESGKVNVCSVEFECRKLIRKLHLDMPPYLVAAELEEPIVTDISKAFEAKAGEITEIPVYDSGELIYTLTLCWDDTIYDTMPANSKDFAILVTSEAEQEYNVEGFIGNGEYHSRSNVFNITASRIYTDDGIEYPEKDKEKARCEELLGIEADALADNCGLFLFNVSNVQFESSDPELRVFNINAFIRKCEGYTETVNPRDYVTK